MSVVSLLGYLNSALNPILYAMALRDVRNAAGKAYTMCRGWLRFDRVCSMCNEFNGTGIRNNNHTATNPLRLPPISRNATSAVQHDPLQNEHLLLGRSGWRRRLECPQISGPPNNSCLVRYLNICSKTANCEHLWNMNIAFLIRHYSIILTWILKPL